MVDTLRIQTGALFVFIFFVIAMGVPIRSESLPQAVRLARVIEVGESGVRSPFGLAYRPATETFVTLSPAPGEAAARLMTFDFFGDGVRRATGPVLLRDPLNVAFDGAANRLYLLDPSSQELLAAPVGDDDFAALGQADRADARHLGLADAQGMTVDPGSGRLFILDSGARRVVRVGGNALLAGTAQPGEIRLGEDIASGVRGIAYNPADGYLYLLHPAGQTLYRLSTTGRLTATYALPDGAFRDPQNMVFAPSGDLTDEPGRMSLYVADGAAGGSVRIVELAFTDARLLPRGVPTTEAVLVQVIDTSQFDPPSPDSAGLAYISDARRLMMSDSEVNEMTIYEDANVFEMSLAGQLLRTFNTMALSREPTGVAYNPHGRRLFFSDDDNDEVYELAPGPDGAYGTADDVVTSFDTRAFDSHDPEGIAYDGVENRLFIADGVNAEIYLVSTGRNGIFDGADDRVSHFDTESLGLHDLEGIEFNPDTGTLYIVGKPAGVVLETTTGGQLVQLIDISAASPRTPAGLAYALRSDDPDLMSLYVSERGVDNDTNPDENDGKIYEFGLDIPASPPTPTPTGTPPPTATATSTPTIVPPTPTPPRDVKTKYVLNFPLVLRATNGGESPRDVALP